MADLEKISEIETGNLKFETIEKSFTDDSLQGEKVNCPGVTEDMVRALEHRIYAMAEYFVRDRRLKLNYFQSCVLVCTAASRVIATTIFGTSFYGIKDKFLRNEFHYNAYNIVAKQTKDFLIDLKNKYFEKLVRFPNTDRKFFFQRFIRAAKSGKDGLNWE